MTNLNHSKYHYALLFLFVVLSGFLLSSDGQAAPIRERGGHEHEFLDSRYHHDRYYPARGQFVHVLPRGSCEVVHGNTRYYFAGGAWYHREGVRFIVVAPPIGMIIPFLPPYYATIWVDSVPYYYANEVYYTPGTGGYVVVAPPQGKVSQTPPSANQLFIYPRQGQSEQQQADDRYACHSWAVSQTGFDPTQPPSGMSGAEVNQKRNDYQRAMSACLEGRGYTVK